MRRLERRPEPVDTRGVLPLVDRRTNDLLAYVAPRPGEHVLDLMCEAQIPSSLPFEDASFDVVLCRHGLQLVPDRSRALCEMRRVLVPSGRVGVSVPGRIERSPAFAALADSLHRRAGVQVAAAVHWCFSLSEPDDLRALLAEAGFDVIFVHTARMTNRLPSVTEFIRKHVEGSPIDSAMRHLSDDVKRNVVSDLQTELAPFIDADGLRITTEANAAVARR